MSTETPEDFENAVKTLVAVRDNIKHLNTNLKELKTREKALKVIVQKGMVHQDIEKINVRSGESIKRSSRTSKGGLTKPVIRKTLMQYFDDNEEEVDRIMNMMENNRTSRKVESITIRAPKSN